MFMASVGAAAKTFDEMIATIHLNKTTHSMEAYKDLLEDLVVSIRQTFINSMFLLIT